MTRSTFLALSGLAFLATYAVLPIGFDFFINWYDTGHWHSDIWPPMAVAGLLTSGVALWVEERTYRAHGYWPQHLLLYLGRAGFTGTVCLATSFTLGNLMAFGLMTRGAIEAWPSLLAIPLMTAIYLLMMVPFGVFAGLVTGLLFRLSHGLQASPQAS